MSSCYCAQAPRYRIWIRTWARERKGTSRRGVSVCLLSGLSYLLITSHPVTLRDHGSCPPLSPCSLHSLRRPAPLRAQERDSPRDQWVVTFFILIVVVLLLTASIRNRYVPTPQSRVYRDVNEGTGWIKRLRRGEDRRISGHGARYAPPLPLPFPHFPFLTASCTIGTPSLGHHQPARNQRRGRPRPVLVAKRVVQRRAGAGEWGESVWVRRQGVVSWTMHLWESA